MDPEEIVDTSRLHPEHEKWSRRGTFVDSLTRFRRQSRWRDEIYTLQPLPPRKNRYFPAKKTKIERIFPEILKSAREPLFSRELLIPPCRLDNYVNPSIPKDIE